MSQSEDYSWVNLMGTFEKGTDELTFRGRELPVPTPQQKEERKGPAVKPKQQDKRTAIQEQKTETPTETRALIGQSICDQRFTEGRISVEVEFGRVDYDSVAEIVLQYNPVSEDMLTIGLGGLWNAFFSLRQWSAAEEGAGGPSGQAPGKAKNWKYLRSGGDRSNLHAYSSDADHPFQSDGDQDSEAWRSLSERSDAGLFSSS